MIVTLTPEPGFAPVPHIRVSIVEAQSWDGGTPQTEGPDTVSGGYASLDSVGFDGGSPFSRAVELPDGTDTVTLLWQSEGGEDLVAGAVQRPITTAFAHLDVEAGFDVATAYELECFAGTQPLGRVSLGSTVLPWEGDADDCLVQQPLNPYLHAVVANLEGSWPSLTWNAPGELVRTQGSRTPTLVGAGPRQAAEEVAVDFGAPSRDVAARVRATLGTQAEPQLPVWLIRTHQGILPRRFYAHVKSLKETDLDEMAGGEVWSEFTATVSEIARPAPGLQVSPLSYTDLDVSYASYTARDGAYRSYDEMDTDWALAGASG